MAEMEPRTEPKTEPKTELLVFNKKEIGIIILLLVLVSLFSFTLGLKLGKTLGVAKIEVAEQVPLVAEKKHTALVEEHGKSEEASLLDDEKVDPKVSTDKAIQKAEDHADAQFAAESKKEGVKIAKPVPMAFPEEKKGEGRTEVSYTLQVGAHRTVAEAAEQVSQLKRSDLDAFYIEAKVPGKGTWYRVGIGAFPSKELAEKAAAKWKSSKTLPSFIIQKIE